jgi:hypothetical protein
MKSITFLVSRLSRVCPLAFGLWVVFDGTIIALFWGNFKRFEAKKARKKVKQR